MPENDPIIPSTDAIAGAAKTGPAVGGGAIIPTTDTIGQVVAGSRAGLKASLSLAVQQDPDQQAQHQAIAAATNLPVDMVDRHPDEAKRVARMGEIDVEQLHRDHPELAQWLSDPSNAAIAHDDLPVLGRLNRAVKQLQAGPHDDALGILPSGFKFSGNGSIIEPLQGGLAQVYPTIEDLQRELQHRSNIANIQADAQAQDASQLQSGVPFLNQVAAGMHQSVQSTRNALGTQTPDEARNASDISAAAQELSPGLWGDVQRGVGGLIGDLPLMLAGGPIGEASATLLRASRARAILSTYVGTRGAKAAATAAQTAASVQPLAIREGLNGANQNGGGFGTVDWLIETAVPGAFGRTGIQRALIPGVDPIAKAGADTYRAGAKFMLHHAGLEATEEATTELAHAFHERVSGVNPDALTPGQLLPRLAAAGAVGGIAAGVFNAPEAIGRKFETDALAIRQSQREADALAAAFDAARSSKLAERSPAKLADLVQVTQQAAGVPGSMVLFQTDDWTEHWQSQGEDPAAAAQRMGVSPEVYAAALVGDGQIAVPMDQFLAKAREEERPLMEKGTLRPNAMTRAELGTATEGLRTELGNAMAQAATDAQAQASPSGVSADKVQQDVEAQLVTSGVGPDAARSQAKLWRQAFLHLTERFNVGAEARGAQPLDPFALYESHKVRIQRQTPDVVRPGEATAAPTGTVLEQPARGQITIGADRSLSIDLLTRANLSTFLHESGHAYLEVISDLVARPDAPQGMRDDMESVRKWVGATAPGFTVEQHEQFARGFEAYLMEGKSPSATLRGAFSRFKGWLVEIYKSLVNLRVTLTPEVRSVFDRIIASDREIAAAAQVFSVEPMWRSAVEMGGSEADFTDYAKSIDQAKASGADKVRAELMRDELRGRKEARAQELAELLVEKATEIDARPEYIAIRALQEGVFPGAHMPGGVSIKLDRGELVSLYGEPALKDLPGPRAKGQRKANSGRHVYAADGGMALEDAAHLFGFTTGDDLWKGLTTAPDREQLIRYEADTELRRRHPDPLTDGSLQEEARSAMANELSGEVLVQEVKALATRTGGRVAPTELLKQTARGIIDRMRARDLRPEVYQQAAAKAARTAFDAAARARDAAPEHRAAFDLEAFQGKQRELWNLHLYRAARDAKKAAEKGQKFLARFDDLATRERIGKAGGWEWSVYGPDGSVVSVEADEAAAITATRTLPGSHFERTNGYLEQIDAILEGYDLRRASVKSLRRRESLSAWIQRQTEAGDPIDIPDSVVADLGRRAWNDLSVSEQADLVDAVTNIEHNATLKHKLLKAQKERQIEKVRGLLVGTITEHGGTKKIRRIGTTAPEAAVDRFWRYLEDHRKDAFLAREIDGNQDGGNAWEYLIRPRTEAANDEAERTAAAAKLRDEIYGEWNKKAGVIRREIPGTQMRLTTEQRIGMALNWGNPEGRQRVLMYANQAKFAERDVLAVIDSLDQEDWRLVKDTWKQLDSYWSEIAALEQRTTGLAPQKVEALSIPTRFGDQPGGYYPIKYDQRLSNKAGDLQAQTEAKQALRTAFAASQTRRGHTKQRSQKVDGFALRLDFGVVGEHLGEVIHDLTHREMLIDQNRILRDKEISGALIDHYGRGALDQFVNTASDIAVGDKPARAPAERFLRRLRQNSSAAVFGFNLTSALMNFTGFLQSVPRVGAGRMLWAVGRVFKDATHLEASTTWVEQTSSFMRTRGQTMLREIAEASRRVEATGFMDNVKRWGYWPMVQVQRSVDTVTWIAAHDKAMSDGQKAGKGLAEATADAVAIADQTVIDTQGSGRLGDLSAFQRGGEVAKLLTAFYSYFNVAYNLQREGVRQVRRDDPMSWLRLGTTTMMVWTLPAFLSSAIGAFLRGDKDHDDKRWEKALREQAGYGFGMLVGLRELSGSVEGQFDYSGPAGARGLGVLYRLIAETGQMKADAGWVKAVEGAGGLFGLPSVEAQRLVDAWILADEQGAGSALRAALFGKPRK